MKNTKKRRYIKQHAFYRRTLKEKYNSNISSNFLEYETFIITFNACSHQLYSLPQKHRKTRVGTKKNEPKTICTAVQSSTAVSTLIEPVIRHDTIYVPSEAVVVHDTVYVEVEKKEEIKGGSVPANTDSQFSTDPVETVAEEVKEDEPAPVEKVRRVMARTALLRRI